MNAGHGLSRLPCLLVLSLSLCLNFWWIHWGQPGGVDWDFDSIAGLQSVKEARYFPSEWRHKYPPVHFLINAALYRPLLTSWFGRPSAAPLAEGRILADEQLGRRFGLLIVISHVASALMGSGCVLAVMLAGSSLFGDARAGLFAGLSLALSQMLVFYSHLGTVDVPATFWFCWALYAAVRAARRPDAPGFVLLGVTAALSAGTKDAVAGYLIGLAAALLAALVPGATPRSGLSRGAFVSGFTLQVLAGVAAFGICFAFFNGLFHDPSLLAARLGHWIEGPGTTDYNRSFAGHADLLLGAGRDLALSLGWPLAVTAAFSAIYVTARAPIAAGFGLIPPIAFYLVIVVPTRLAVPRYFLPALAALALLVGKGCADWSRWGRVPAAVRAAMLALVFAPSLLYCAALDLELSDDTRYRAERWFVDNVAPGTRAALLCPPLLAPRLRLFGFTEDYRYAQPTRAEVLTREPPFPPYLVLVEKHFVSRDLFDPIFLERLLRGEEGYDLVATIRNRYLYPERSLPGLAGWGLPKLSQVSPVVHILKRNDGTPPAAPER